MGNKSESFFQTYYFHLQGKSNEDLSRAVFIWKEKVGFDKQLVLSKTWFKIEMELILSTAKTSN